MRTVRELRTELGQIEEVFRNIGNREHIATHNRTLYELCLFFEPESCYRVPIHVHPHNSVNIEKLVRRLQEEKIPFSVFPETVLNVSANLHEVDIAPEIFGTYSFFSGTYVDLLTGRVSNPSNLHINYGFTKDLETPTAFLRGKCYNAMFSNQHDATRILKVLQECCKGYQNRVTNPQSPYDIPAKILQFPGFLDTP